MLAKFSAKILQQPTAYSHRTAQPVCCSVTHKEARGRINPKEKKNTSKIICYDTVRGEGFANVTGAAGLKYVQG
jgi:hypothetical protein